MRLKLGLANHFWWSIAPLITGSIFVASPSLAATLASSGGELTITNINQTPQGFVTLADTNTFTTAENGSTVAAAGSQAEFTVNASTSASFTEAFGEGVSYQGSADGISLALGNFSVQANEYLTFDFTASLNLEASIDTLQSESASAMGNLTFSLIDSTTQFVYDSFSILSNLTTPGDSDGLEYQTSGNISLTNKSTETSFGGTQESAKASVQGSLQHLFTSPTNLTLVAVTTNQASVASVKTPESSSALALLGFFGAMGIWYGVKRKVSGAKSELTPQLQLASIKAEAISKL
jgi:hypothetical protein